MEPIDYYRDKVILITGGSMGIGKELARQALELGAKVAITGRNTQRLQAAAEEFSLKAENLYIHPGDVANYDDDINLIGEVVKRFSKLDIVISNAGMSAFGDLAATSKKVVDELIDTNVKGALFLYIAAIAELKKTRGSILFISSNAAFRGLPSYSLYSSSKMALTSIVQSIRIENEKNGVYSGIAYVGFTENENAKRTISPDGKLEKVPERNKFLLSSRTETARIILNQIRKRKPVVIHSFTGKMNYFLCRFVPFIVRFLHRNIYRKLN